MNGDGESSDEGSGDGASEDRASEDKVPEDGAIIRVWHGWTDPTDADAYERFLTDEEEGLLATMSGEGYLGYDLLRRETGEEVEFVTQLHFADYDAVAEFAGEDYEEAHVPAAARELLSRWEEGATHYEHRAGERR